MQEEKPGTRFGVAVGVISVAFSTLCFVIVPVFTPAFLLAALFGLISGGLCLALKARRSAWVAFVFALVPLCGFLVLEYVVEYVGNGHVFFVPLAAAMAFAAWALIDYSRATRAARPTPP
jgi:hypothetical protein